MVNVKEWQKRREEHIENGGPYNQDDCDLIQVNMDDELIKDFIIDNDLDRLDISTDDDFGHLLSEIKTSIYMEDLKNDERHICNWLIEKDEDVHKMFPKFFFTEMVCDLTKNFDSYEDVLSSVNELNKIKDFLDENPKYHGFTGDMYQNSELWDLIKELTGKTYSMRNWGSIMSAYMNSRDKERIYHYISFYM